MPVLFSCQSLTKSFSGRTLFQNITLGVDDSEKLGLIGPNGSGKSTLLKIFAGLEKPDSGTLSVRRNLRLGYLPQDEKFAPGLSAEQIVASALDDTALDPIEAQIRVASTMSRLEFDDPSQEASTLSGGWRKRLALARELVREPDVLLLDEPTNHLDLAGVLWLESLLQSAPFAFVLVSHDRTFLENVTNRTVELNPVYSEGFFSVAGSYSEFLVKRQDYLDTQAHQEVALAGKVKREIEWLRRGPQARTTKAQARIDSAGRLIQNLADVKSRNAEGGRIALDFQASGRKTRDLLVAKGVNKALGGRTLLSELDLVLSPGMRLGLIGPNGSGKTTLLRLLTGELMPDSGAIRRADGLRTVLFDQNRAALDQSLSLRDALSPNGETVMFRGSPIHVSGWAKRFRFRSEQLHMPLSVFSGGEQARVLIAQLMLQPADLLILDEPTNDLDIPTLEVLEDSLEDFPGALVLVTHDRYMLDQVSTEVLALDGDGRGGAHVFADYAQWQRSAAQPPAAPRRDVLSSAATPQPSSGRLSTAERREWKQIEDKIEAAEARVAEIQAQLEDPAVVTNPTRLQQNWDDLATAKDDVTRLYERWAELEAKQSG